MAWCCGSPACCVAGMRCTSRACKQAGGPRPREACISPAQRSDVVDMDCTLAPTHKHTHGGPGRLSRPPSRPSACAPGSHAHSHHRVAHAHTPRTRARTHAPYARTHTRPVRSHAHTPRTRRMRTTHKPPPFPIPFAAPAPPAPARAAGPVQATPARPPARAERSRGRRAYARGHAYRALTSANAYRALTPANAHTSRTTRTHTQKQIAMRACGNRYRHARPHPDIHSSHRARTRECISPFTAAPAARPPPPPRTPPAPRGAPARSTRPPRQRAVACARRRGRPAAARGWARGGCAPPRASAARRSSCQTRAPRAA